MLLQLPPASTSILGADSYFEKPPRLPNCNIADAANQVEQSVETEPQLLGGPVLSGKSAEDALACSSQMNKVNIANNGEADQEMSQRKRLQETESCFDHLAVQSADAQLPSIESTTKRGDYEHHPDDRHSYGNKEFSKLAQLLSSTEILPQRAASSSSVSTTNDSCVKLPNSVLYAWKQLQKHVLCAAEVQIATPNQVTSTSSKRHATRTKLDSAAVYVSFVSIVKMRSYSFELPGFAQTVSALVNSVENYVVARAGARNGNGGARQEEMNDGSFIFDHDGIKAAGALRAPSSSSVEQALGDVAPTSMIFTARPSSAARTAGPHLLELQPKHLCGICGTFSKLAEKLCDPGLLASMRNIVQITTQTVLEQSGGGRGGTKQSTSAADLSAGCSSESDSHSPSSKLFSGQDIGYLIDACRSLNMLHTPELQECLSTLLRQNWDMLWSSYGLVLVTQGSYFSTCHLAAPAGGTEAEDGRHSHASFYSSRVSSLQNRNRETVLAWRCLTYRLRECLPAFPAGSIVKILKHLHQDTVRIRDLKMERGVLELFGSTTTGSSPGHHDEEFGGLSQFPNKTEQLSATDVYDLVVHTKLLEDTKVATNRGSKNSAVVHNRTNFPLRTEVLNNLLSRFLLQLTMSTSNSRSPLSCSSSSIDPLLFLHKLSLLPLDVNERLAKKITSLLLKQTFRSGLSKHAESRVLAVVPRAWLGKEWDRRLLQVRGPSRSGSGSLEIGTGNAQAVWRSLPDAVAKLRRGTGKKTAVAAGQLLKKPGLLSRAALVSSCSGMIPASQEVCSSLQKPQVPNGKKVEEILVVLHECEQALRRRQRPAEQKLAALYQYYREESALLSRSTSSRSSTAAVSSSGEPAKDGIRISLDRLVIVLSLADYSRALWSLHLFASQFVSTWRNHWGQTTRSSAWKQMYLTAKLHEIFVDAGVRGPQHLRHPNARTSDVAVPTSMQRLEAEEIFSASSIRSFLSRISGGFLSEDGGSFPSRSSIPDTAPRRPSLIPKSNEQIITHETFYDTSKAKSLREGEREAETSKPLNFKDQKQVRRALIQILGHRGCAGRTGLSVLGPFPTSGQTTYGGDNLFPNVTFLLNC
ncbi:unnamed protein product [Amoebophrya sp. A120]|nr:unnamed protein product [Amoebophrya sp. A120]|eukprot:GSA120T00021840001.1